MKLLNPLNGFINNVYVFFFFFLWMSQISNQAGGLHSGARGVYK